MTADDIKLIGVMGSGVMGGGISQTFAQFGYQVIVRDLNDEILARSRDTIENGRFGIRTAVTRGLMTKEQAQTAIDCISYTARAEDLRDVDLLVEAIPERLELKQSEFGRLGQDHQSAGHLCLEYLWLCHRRARARGERPAQAALRRLPLV